MFTRMLLPVKLNVLGEIYRPDGTLTLMMVWPEKAPSTLIAKGSL